MCWELGPNNFVIACVSHGPQVTTPLSQGKREKEIFLLACAAFTRLTISKFYIAVS